MLVVGLVEWNGMGMVQFSSGMRRGGVSVLFFIKIPIISASTVILTLSRFVLEIIIKTLFKHGNDFNLKLLKCKRNSIKFMDRVPMTQ